MAGDNHDGRVYVILRIDGDRYEQLPTVTASSAEQAVKRAAAAIDDKALEAGVKLVAIPARNWTPIGLTLERRDRLVTDD
jgi:hypothetical protein